MVREGGVSFRTSPENLGEDNKITGIVEGTILTVLETVGDWYCVRYKGEAGYVTASPLYCTVIETGEDGGADFEAEGEKDMGPPQLGGRVISPGEMNLAVLWVQTQLKALSFRQGRESGVEASGLLDDATVRAVRDFMRGRGFSNPSGWIDGTVIAELTGALNGKTVSVPVGGIYRAMDSIIGQGCTGSMAEVAAGREGGTPGVTVIARWAQVCLRYLGYYTGEITGRFDEKTARALEAFEAEDGYTQRDFLTPGTARTLLERYAWAGGSLRELP